MIAAIDTLVSTRQFEDSQPGAPAPLGKSTKFPLSVADHLGAQPRRAVLEVVGGQAPQHLVSEFARVIRGEGAETSSCSPAPRRSPPSATSRKSENKPDFSDDPADTDGIYEDRGFGLKGLMTREQAAHALISAPVQYGLVENARRAMRGESRREHVESMGALFAPFTEVAADNPFSAAPGEHSAEELITVDENNRMIADPYPRRLVARDQVNQSAAVLLASVATARRLGVDESKWVFLHGQADLAERSLMQRPTWACGARRARRGIARARGRRGDGRRHLLLRLLLLLPGRGVQRPRRAGTRTG